MEEEKVIMDKRDPAWTDVIVAKGGGFNLRLREIWRYRDLVMLLVKRDLVAIYKQTVLGPLWLIIQPVLTTLTYTLIFGRLANLPVEGPPILFYMSGVIVWSYFSDNLIKTSNTFISNANLFGKVYFPRLVVPVSITISNIVAFGAQFALFIIIYAYYSFSTNLQLNYTIFYLPLVLFVMAGLGLSFGIIISSFTTKYRDLRFLVTFGTQLLMFFTPVVLPLSFFSENVQQIMLLNPMAPVLELFKSAFLNTPAPPVYSIVYSVCFTVVSLLVGTIVFNRVERNFMDTV